MNNYKKALLGMQGFALVTSAVFAVKPQPFAPRDRMVASVVSGVVTLWLIWNA